MAIHDIQLAVSPKTHNKRPTLKAEENRFSHLYQTQRYTCSLAAADSEHGSSRCEGLLYLTGPACLACQLEAWQEQGHSFPRKIWIRIWGHTVRYLFASGERNLQELEMSRKPQRLPQIPSWPTYTYCKKTFDWVGKLLSIRVQTHLYYQHQWNCHILIPYPPQLIGDRSNRRYH